MRTLIIGKIFNPNILGFYNKGKQFPELIISNISGSIQSVMLPALSSYQDDLIKVKNLMRRSIKTSSFIIFPMMMGLAIVSKPLIEIVLTEKWLPAVSILQIYCIILALRPIHTANAQAINALGRSDIFLKIEVMRTIIGIIILIVSIPFGMFAIVIGELLSAVISTYLYTYPNAKLIGYSIYEQVIDILPSLLITLIMGLIIFPVKLIGFPNWIVLIIQFFLGL
jgi:teichuronic acid exporter